MMRLSPWFLFLCLPALTSAQEICTGHFVDPGTGHPTQLDLLVSSPRDGTELDRPVFAPGCGTSITVGGTASTIGIPPRIDFYLVIDSSGSTAHSSGADASGNGRIDTILAAELAAARAFVDAVDLANNRVAIVEFDDGGRLVVPLTQQRDRLLDGLTLLRNVGPGGGTNYGAAFSAAVGEHDRGHDPTRDQILLFLSDGHATVFSDNPPLAGLEPCIEPPWFDSSACSGVYWAEHAHGTRGIRTETFAVGLGARPQVLQEMADRGEGNFTPVAIAGDIATVLPEVNLVGIAEVRVKSLDTLEEVVAELTPDGAFTASIEVLPGVNDLVVTGIADHDDAWTVSCERRLTLRCAEYECPEPQLRECEDGGAEVETLRPWTSHPAIAVSSPQDGDGDGDAGGLYPLGVTEVEFTLTDVEGNQRHCSTTVEVRDTLPPELQGVPADANLECTAAPPDPAAVTASDRCEPDLPVAFSETETVLDCPANRDLLRRWTVSDSAGNSAEGGQLVRIRDTQPPVVATGDEDLHCFRAASHWMLELSRDDFAPVVSDACSEVVDWVFVGCESDQAENDRGDGHTAPDCIVDDDGEGLSVRGERDGRVKDGRRYAVSVAAVDACGNWSEPARIGHVRILHDLREGRHDCPRVPAAGTRR
jgi:hypothetical protein